MFRGFKGQFFQNLMDGDPVAWAIVLGFIGLGVIALIVIARVRSVHQREDEERKNKWLKKPKKD